MTGEKARTETKYDVFISYSHLDKTTADAICASLEQDGIRCWYAPRDILPGSDWAASIMHAIESVRVMVLVYTDESNMSRQVLNEISNAVNNGTVIVPFRLTESPPSKGLQYYFASVHWLDAVDEPLEKSIEKLRTLIRCILSSEPAPAGTETPVPGKRKPKRAWIAAAAAAVLALAAALVFFLPRTPPETPGTPAATEEPAAVGASDALPWPQNGEIWRREDLGESPVALTIRVEQEADRTALIRIYRRDDTPVSTVFVGGEDSVTVWLPAGWYWFSFAYPERWLGMDETVRTAAFTTRTFSAQGDDTVSLESTGGYTLLFTNPGKAAAAAEPTAAPDGTLPWPETGELWRSEELGNSPIAVTFSFNQKEDRGTLVRICGSGDRHVSTVFALGQKEVTVGLPVGWYSVDYYFLREWTGTEAAFVSADPSPVYFDDEGSDLACLFEAGGYLFRVYNPEE